MKLFSFREPLRSAAAGVLFLTLTARGASLLTVQIDPTQSFQQMQGFGASLTESSASLISTSMSGSQRQALMNSLFDRTSGIGLSFLRQPMGSSDFALSPYSYDDRPLGQTDHTLSNFSIARDQQQIIPLLQQARALNPNLRIMGTPWSPPAWMKQASAAQPQAEQMFGGHLKNSDAVYNTYADYFVKYVQAYAAAGVKVNYVSLQNEPWYETTKYPSMGMDPWEQARLVKLVGPKFVANNIDTKLLAWDHNWDNAANYTSQLFNDPQAKQYFAGVAFHGYGGNVSAQSAVHDAYPDKGVFFTELSSSIYNTNFAGDLMWDMQNLIVGGTRNWASSIVRWNLALDATGNPRLPGGAPNCRGMVTINPSTGQVTLNEEYYSIAHVSKFVQPGAFRVSSDVDHSVAFINPDGSTAMIAYNDATSAQDVSVHWKGRGFTYRLPAQSVATFAWSDPRGSAVQVWLTSGDRSKLLARQSDLNFVAGSWSLNGAGDWFNNSNWTAGAPNGADAEANFFGAISSPHTVWANKPVTVGTIRFNNPNRYVLAGASQMTLQASTGSASIDVQNGSHQINLPLTFASDTQIAVAAGAKLAISDPVTVNPAVHITQSGDVTYDSTIRLGQGASLAQSGTTFAAVAEMFKSNDVAIFDNALAGAADFPFGSGHALAPDAIVAAAARIGDIDLDGTVSTTDLFILDAHLGAHPQAGIAWLFGDVNVDGIVDASDAAIVSQNIPEPGVLAWVFIALWPCVAKRRMIVVKSRGCDSVAG